MTTPRRWLVFGGSGFLGVQVVRAILERGGAAVVAGRAALPPGLASAEVPHVNVDALRPGDVERALDTGSPDHVVVVAALATLTECERYPVLARTLNVEFPALIAERARALGAHVTFVSTDLVFGGVPALAGRYTELDAPSPLSEYGRTKTAGESAVHASGPDTLVVRVPLLFGDSFGRERGASDALLAAVRRGEVARLFTDEWRTPLDVAVAAHGLVGLAAGRVTGLRHLAGTERLSRYDLGVRVLHEAGYPLEAVRSAIEPCTRAEAGLASRPADVSLATVHDPEPTLT